MTLILQLCDMIHIHDTIIMVFCFDRNKHYHSYLGEIRGIHILFPLLLLLLLLLLPLLLYIKYCIQTGTCYVTFNHYLPVNISTVLSVWKV